MESAHLSLRLPKKLIVLGLTLSVTLIPIPSKANSFDEVISDVRGKFNEIVEQFEGYFSSLDTYLDQVAEQVFGSIADDINVAIEAATGQMEIPDPITAREVLAESLGQGEKAVLMENPVTGTRRAANKLDREMTRASIASVLGEAGQERVASEIEGTKEAVSQTSSLANLAQNMDASQKVLKAIAAQNGQMASVLGQQRIDAMLARQDAQYANLNLSNISETLDAEAKERRMTLMGEAAYELSAIAGNSLLDTIPTQGEED
ncbi:MAG TPA: hypothetical protein DCL61_15435 [Cyanobacteria bacterium UBA12227]|nr:hypothetical protein [Cyanobacteria bacterium UBA12227]HAX88364.1 hypothetical protein [Cyanobacteria bacterium UBA11370]HBY77849.1 hypothetical protein [Cyanobacteria bacterium UBA11148]